MSIPLHSDKPRGNLYIHGIGQLVTMAGPVRRGREAMNDIGLIPGPATLVIEDGVITYAGTEKGAPTLHGFAPEEVIDAGGNCVLPGFVDSHTHLVFGGYREDEFQWRLAGESYMSIMERGGGIASTTRATREASCDELYRKSRAHLDDFLTMGVTTVESKSGYGLDKETEIRQLEVAERLDREHSIDLYRTYMGAHDLSPEFRDRGFSAYTDFIIREMLPLVKERGLASAVDVFTEKGVFELEDSRRLLSAAKEMGFKVKMHADEIYPLGGARLAAECGCLSADHLLKISEEGIAKLAHSDTVATCLPLTAFSLRDNYAPARRMIDEGCAVALASDLNPGSCFSSSVPLMIALATIYMGMTVEEALTALTINGAAAIDSTSTIGSLEAGKKGDAVILRYPGYKFLSYHFGVNLVRTTIKAGKVVYDYFV